MSRIRKTLIINGTERSFLCDPEKDTLVDVIRNLGLTGTKVGCGAGQCGACNIIINGKLVRSCVKKITTVEDYSDVLTIEGIGTADHLHPLQKAWILYGGVQCGFCSPGFILSAKVLLDENPDPTREEVREWFLKNRNACRCTGYKPLVDAVMAAAKVMRGEMPIEELEYKDLDGQVFNTSYPKPSALGKVMGTTDYAADIAEKDPDMLHLALVLPEYSHAIIKSIDISEAEAAPGVVKVVTAKDVKGTNRLAMPLGNPWANGDGADKPVLCEDKVFRIGDPIAVVCAETRRQAREAAKLVKIEYEVLPEYIDILDAARPDTVEIHPGIPNLYAHGVIDKGADVKEIFETAPHVAEFSFGTQRQSHLPIEPDCGNAFIDKDGVLNIMYKAHGVYMVKFLILGALGLPPDKVRVYMNPSGGAFGYSCGVGTPAILGVCAMATGRPVSLVMSYKEHQHTTGKRGPQYTNCRIACDEKGKILAVEAHTLGDKGCYSDLTNGTINGLMKFFGYMYNIPNARMVTALTFSNTPFVTAYRCPGAMEINTVSEQLMDTIAEKIGIDPLEFRAINCWKEEDCDPLWVTKPLAYVIPKELEQAKPIYERLKEQAKKNSAPGKPHGVGVSMGGFRVAGWNDHAEVKLELTPDNQFVIYNTWEDMGQGADIGTLAMTHELLKPLGVKASDIRMVNSDTGVCPNTGISGSSRQNFMNQNTIADACSKMIEAMKKDDGTYRTYNEMVAEGIPTSVLGIYDAPGDTDNIGTMQNGLGAGTFDGTYSVYLAEVEVEEETGKVKIVEYHVITDVGTTTNQLSLEGQAYSGLMHSAGFALSEDYSDMKKHVNLAGCGFPYITVLPDGEQFTFANLETPREYSALGGSGCSEGFQASGQSCILNAIYDAVGVRVGSTPATPAKIKAAIEAKKDGTYAPQEPYDLSEDFETVFTYMTTHQPASFKVTEIGQ